MPNDENGREHSMTEQRKTRVLVTGASGFLGGNILKSMVANPGIECVAACRNRTKLPVDFSGEVRVGDLLDPIYRQELPTDINVICHAGIPGPANHPPGPHLKNPLVI